MTTALATVLLISGLMYGSIWMGKNLDQLDPPPCQNITECAVEKAQTSESDAD